MTGPRAIRTPRPRSWLLTLVVISLLASCASRVTGDGLPIPANLTPVSASSPSSEAAAVLARCGVGMADSVRIDQVKAMGQVPVSDIAHFVGLTGREPQLAEKGLAWIIQTKGDFPQPGGDVWTDETCIATPGDVVWYATGPIRTSAGVVLTPEPAQSAPDRGLPPLSP